MFGSTRHRLMCATTLACGLAFGATLAGGLTVAATAAHAADELAPLPGNVAGWVPAATKAGTAHMDKSVVIAVHMSLRDIGGLKALADSVSKPGSAQYGRYLTPAAFAARFAPDATDAASVKSWLESAGLKNVAIGPAATSVSATATVAQIMRTFSVSQDLYSYAGHKLRANREAPMVPAALASKIVSIEGLNEAGALRHPMHRSILHEGLHAPNSYVSGSSASVTPPPVAASLPSPYCDTYFNDLKATLSTAPKPYAASLPWLTCGYTPQQTQAAYGFDRTKLDGTGVRVAILDAYASPTLMADGNAYAANHGLPKLTSANFTQIIPEGIYNVSPDETCAPYGWWEEESLDLAAVHGTAPGAHIVYIGARDCNSSLSLALENAIYNQQADIITNSYGYNGEADSAADIAAQDQAFMTAAAEGITVLFSSGDDGDLSQVNGIATGSFSATSPYVTGVGGTSLGVLNAKGDKVEYGWGNYRDYLNAATVNSSTSITTSGLATTGYPAPPSPPSVTYDAFVFYSGAGGGISVVEAQPAYQAGVVPTALATTLNEGNGQTITLPTPHRVSPDISMLADPYTGYLFGESFTTAGNPISDSGCTPTSSTTEYCENPIGGTSLASPLMAGAVAVWDQARLAAGKPVAGFINPLIYTFKTGAKLKSAAVNDVLPPAKPMAVLRGYANNLSRVRVVTLNSVPLVIQPTPFPLEPCAATICEGINDVFNFVTPGYDDVTGLGVPYLPMLIKQ